MPISDEKIGDFLDQLADRVPAPGGGAAAALHAAQGAALLGMVARYTTGEKYAEHQVTIGRISTEADELRGIALRLADADADAFTAVAAAYRLPAASAEERATRSAAIAQALVGAAWPAAQVISVAGMVVDLAGALVVIGNRNVVSDVAAAAEAARAAAATARCRRGGPRRCGHCPGERRDQPGRHYRRAGQPGDDRRDRQGRRHHRPG